MLAAVSPPSQPPAIDVHAHVAVPAADALLEGQPGLAQQRAIDAATLGQASLQLNLRQIAEIGPKLVDLELRLAAMDAARVDVQAVSATPVPHSWADCELATRCTAAVAPVSVVQHTGRGPRPAPPGKTGAYSRRS